MIGAPIGGPTYMYCDNMSVVNNTTSSESILENKSNSIAYHAVPDTVVMGEILIAYIPKDDNVADLMTKAILGGERFACLVKYYGI
jgi:hypothetical protein